MRCNALVLLIVAIAAECSQAAVVTYTLSLCESPSGTAASNQFAVYATASQGDNSGLAAYSLDLTSSSDSGGPSSLSLVHRSPSGTWDIDDSDENYDGQAYPTKYGGFGAGRSASNTSGIVSGGQDLSRGGDLVRIYGVGQEAHRMNDFKPSPVAGSLGPIAYKDYSAATGTDGGIAPYGVPQNTPGFFTLAAGTVRLLTGSWNGNPPALQPLSANSNARVWKLNTSSDEMETAQLQYATRYMCGDPGPLLWLSNTATSSNRAVGGAISVSGANNGYRSEVNQLLEPPAALGSAPIQTIGDEAGSIYVMVKLLGTAADIARVLSLSTHDVDATDPQFTRCTPRMTHCLAAAASTRYLSLQTSLGRRCSTGISPLAV